MVILSFTLRIMMFKKIRARDIRKNQLAAKHGFTLLRFWEDEIVNDLENVKKRIINALLATT